MEGLIPFPWFQMRYGMPSEPGANEEEHSERAGVTASFVSAGAET